MRERRTSGPYKELGAIAVLEDLLEAGIKAGGEAAVVDIAPEGTLTVDVVEPETGRTLDMLFIETGPPLRVIDRLRINETKE